MAINDLCNYIYISELSAYFGAIHITKGKVVPVCVCACVCVCVCVLCVRVYANMFESVDILV
jgi:hypothetical protein